MNPVKEQPLINLSIVSPGKGQPLINLSIISPAKGQPLINLSIVNPAKGQPLINLLPMYMFLRVVCSSRRYFSVNYNMSSFLIQ